ncbi:YdiU family protein [Paenibacillus sp. IB182496]|uniref:Protein nucleotidyltransferase YdiU n=1 Tax=Paenibacillus sabuli TaxID=2772509 RepID=A0A927BT41_9BACL|nr:YdiU family protein [Paenibacillus sabuli]MBD2846296.1 YdiU family protein [Paenibacillus sabuli]
MTNSDITPPMGWNLDNSYARLPHHFYSKLAPVPVAEPRLAVLNEGLAGALGLDAEALRSAAGVETLAGNRLPEGADPLAQAYTGHQFGHFTMLGDGRALLLGEQRTPDGRRVDIQLKGSGRTPYSRSGDGRAALGPMLREYIISEAMHGLGIPTTRSLAVVSTGEQIVRESLLPGAVLVRVAASHLRVGTFQYAAALDDKEQLRALADYALQRHAPEAAQDEDGRYVGLLRAVIARQAELIARWQLAGFIHGVMNTDNMAVSGETIDYGPCAFMDAYDPETVFSSIDRQGRYAYGNQPRIAAWNLARFAESLLPLLAEDEARALELGEEAIGAFAGLYHGYWLDGMRAKLGLFGRDDHEEDETLVQELLAMLQEQGADYTNAFRALTLERPEDSGLTAADAWTAWQTRWQARLDSQSESREQSLQLMRRSNPAVIPRNHRVEEALAAAEQDGDYGVMHALLAALADPYAYTAEQVAYCAAAPASAGPYRTYCGT